MRFASVCDGIAAAACAWVPLGWGFVFKSEIEPFPDAVAVPGMRWIGERIQLVEALK